MIVTRPQLLMFTGTGATKSLTSAGNDADARLFRNALPKASQVPAGKTPAVVRLLTAPIELLLFSVIWSPQHGNELLERQVFVANPGTVGTDALVSHRSSPR